MEITLPYGTPRFEKAFLLEQMKEEKQDISFMKNLNIYNFSEKEKELHQKIIELHEENYKNLLKKIAQC